MIVTGRIPISSVFIQSRRQFMIIGLAALVAEGIEQSQKMRWIPLDLSWFNVEISALASLGVALGVFLSLRNNIVWDRYWEARSLWGRLINVSRTFPRQLDTFLRHSSHTYSDILGVPNLASSADRMSGVEPVDDAEALERDRAGDDLLRRHIVFTKTFRDVLRDDDPRPSLDGLISAEEQEGLRDAVHVPSAVLHTMGERLNDVWRRGFITDFQLNQLDSSLTEMSDILGGCEKIKNTPLPPAYTFLAHRVVLYYCCLLPFGLVDKAGWFAIVLTLIFSFAFLTLDGISELIENPFSREDNDLPLDSITRNIEREVLQRIGVKELPPKLEPVRGVLL